MGHDDEGPAQPEPAQPEEPQTSVRAQPVGPKPATSDEPDEAADRTLEEESRRRGQSEHEGKATEERREK